MGALEVVGIDGAEIFGKGSAQSFGVDHLRDLIEDGVLVDHILGGVERAGKHQLPVQRKTFAFEQFDIEGFGVVDQTEFSLRLYDFHNLLDVVFGVRKADDVIRLQFQCGKLLGERLVVINDMVRAHLFYPVLSFLPRSSANNGEACELAGKLRHDRADAAGRTDN